MSRRERCSICNEDVVIACQTMCEAIECVPSSQEAADRIQNLKNGSERGKEVFDEDFVPFYETDSSKSDPIDIFGEELPESLAWAFPPEGDPIDHPKHYSRWAMEPIEFIMINDLPGWLANVIKYTMRYDAKDGLTDLYKSRSYLDMKIRQLEGYPRWWEKPVAEERRANRA